jgi:ABC-2 type transport system permease protein
MRKNILKLFARQVYTNAFKNKAVAILTGIIAILLLYAAFSGFINYRQQTDKRILYQKQVRDHWENMPDKHPHRMAHYGYIAFRAKQPLSFFDFGMESYTGNAVFLEAHRQNSINFSDSGFSTGMLRFGEISIAMILQVLLPLIIFFIGFSTVAADRENGTLRILLSQGASWKEIIIGKSLGLFTVAMFILVPTMVLVSAGCLIIQKGTFSGDDLVRILWIMLCYTLFFGIISIIAAVVSSISKTAKLALVSLIGIWLLFAIILPRAAQAFGNYLHPSPSKIEFEAAIEKDLIRKGDSHDPNDPYYKALKDSILRAYKADSIQQLPFNYSGFQMKEGEKMSAEVYNQHLSDLLNTYKRQNTVSKISSFINPFNALRNISMAISGTDFNSYTRFQQQAEDYRYQLAQHMNELQIKLISNKQLNEGDKPYSISKEYWKAFPDFQYKPSQQVEVVRNETISIFALLFWAALLLAIVAIISKTIKAI